MRQPNTREDKAAVRKGQAYLIAVQEALEREGDEWTIPVEHAVIYVACSSLICGRAIELNISRTELAFIVASTIGGVISTLETDPQRLTEDVSTFLGGMAAAGIFDRKSVN